jgi:anaerobic ribonucleoside-triphosphate reductase
LLFLDLDIKQLNVLANFDTFQNGIIKNLVFQDSSSQFLNSSLINQNSKNSNLGGLDLILDKIFINLFIIAQKANGDDSILLEILEERIKNTIEFFQIKKTLLEKRLTNSNEWKQILIKASDNPAKILTNPLASISLLGLHEAIRLHCGIEFERLNTSEQFLWKILDFVKETIDEYNEKGEIRYILSQPHSFYSLNPSQNKNKYLKNYNIETFKTRIINSNSDLPLDKTLKLVKNFQNKFTGGLIFNSQVDIESEVFFQTISKIYDYKLYGFAINSSLTH